ncbi:MAG: hypothetical protein HY063_06870 [Bacteroidetes bacterium]|nr:hypothetical protein [Bacteroidota bacterium]
MKKYFPYFLIFIFISVLLLVFFSQSEPQKFTTTIVPDKFSISIPDYLSKTDNIDSSALLQYKNEKEQLFLLVYEKHDSSSLENFFKKFSEGFASKLEHGVLINYYPEKINGADALLGNIRGSVGETGVFYKVAAIRAKNSFYKIIIGVSENMKSTYEEDMDEIIRGFKNLP